MLLTLGVIIPARCSSVLKKTYIHRGYMVLLTVQSKGLCLLSVRLKGRSSVIPNDPRKTSKKNQYVQATTSVRPSYFVRRSTLFWSCSLDKTNPAHISQLLWFE